MQKLLLDINEVAAALGVGRRTAYALRSDDPDFPKPVPLAARVVRYRTSDVRAYVDCLAAAEPTREPAQLKAGRAAARGSKRGQAGGLLTPDPANPQPARALKERGGVEPREAGQ